MRLPLVIVVAILAGCTSPPANHSFRVNGSDDITVTHDAQNKTTSLALASNVTVTRIQACRDACEALPAAEGMVIAEGSLVSLHNATLNAAGPDADSALFFYDEGMQSGQYVRWDDAGARFETSAPIESLGHIGTLTDVVLGGVSPALVRIGTAALQGPEVATYLRGSGQLVNGSARVVFPEAFALLVGDGLLTAQVTLTSPGPALLVDEKASDHLSVRAADGSASNATFDFLFIAPRAGGEGFQPVR